MKNVIKINLFLEKNKKIDKEENLSSHAKKQYVLFYKCNVCGQISSSKGVLEKYPNLKICSSCY